jgi:hypothetical protein
MNVNKNWRITMSPRFYGFLWVAFLLPAVVFWLGGVFTMMTAVAFGFTAFGLTFVGMMCVLPGMVSHPAVEKIKTQPAARTIETPAAGSDNTKAFTFRSV